MNSDTSELLQDIAELLGNVGVIGRISLVNEQKTGKKVCTQNEKSVHTKTVQKLLENQGVAVRDTHKKIQDDASICW